jgi:hypothetical protein
VGWRSALLPPATRPHVSVHDDIVVRLHQGAHHGRIIAIPTDVRRSGTLAVPTRVGTDPWEAGPWEACYRTDFYQRREVAWYDDVDHTIHLWPYWLAEGARMPPRLRSRVQRSRLGAPPTAPTRARSG